MDQFQYIAKSNSIDKLKTLKAKDAFIREIVNLARDSYVIVDKNNLEVQERYYKLISKALQSYDIDRLPNNIVSSINTLQTKLAMWYIEYNGTYNNFVDTFQFTDEVRLQYTSFDKFETLTNIYMDKPLTFKFKYDLRLDPKYSSILSNIYSSINIYNDTKNISIYSLSTGHILQVEELKRKLPSDITYSIIEDVLSTIYSSIYPKNKVNYIEYADEAILQAEQLLEVTHTTMNKIKALPNGQLSNNSTK